MPTLADEPIANGRPGRNPAIRSDPTREYCAGGLTLLWGSEQVYRTLPPYVDDVTADFGADLYERMMVDPQVALCIHLLKMAVLASGINLVPAVTNEEDEGYEQAQEIAQFVQRCFDRLANLAHLEAGPLYDLLDGMMFGNRVAEQVYEQATEGPDTGKYVLRALKVKPREVFAFLIDPFMNLIGLLAIIPGQAPTLTGGTLIGDPTKARNLLPRSKFAIFTFRPKNGDPRGQSIGRPAYNPWWLKVQVWPEYLKYLAQFAGPSVWGTTPEGASDVIKKDDTGNIVSDADGNPVFTTAQEALLAGLQAWRNGTAAAFPFGTTLSALQMQGAGEPFERAVDLFNREITMAILCQTLATGEAQHDTRAASQVHQDALGQVIGFGKTALQGTLQADVAYNLVRYNFGREAARCYCPEVSLGDTSPEDMAALMTAVAALNTSSWFEPSQLRGMDAIMGLPVRSAEEVEAKAAASQAARDAMTQPQDGNQPPGQQNGGGQQDEGDNGG